MAIRKRRRRRRAPDGSLTKVMRAERVAFARRTADALLKLGAKQTEPATMQDTDHPCGGVFALDTTAGPLRVTAYGDWIATRFEDLDLAVEADSEGLILAHFLKRLAPLLTVPAERAWSAEAQTCAPPPRKIDVFRGPPLPRRPGTGPRRPKGALP